MSGGGGGGSSEIRETEAEKALAEVAAAKFDTYQKHYKPLEAQYRDRVDDIGGDNYQNLVSGMAANQATAGLRQESKDMYQGGLNPNSGQFHKKSAVLNNAIEKSRQAGMAQGQQAAQNAYLSGMANINAIGTGQEAAAMSSTRSLADVSSRNAVMDARSDFADYQNSQANKGALVGVAAAAGKGYMAGGGSPYADQASSQYGLMQGSEQSNMIGTQMGFAGGPIKPYQ